jgi:hypothetical protein
MPGENNAALPPPWAEFLKELDCALRGRVSVHCMGGFVMSFYYGLPRPTGDIDYFSTLPIHCVSDLRTMAGEDSALATKYKVHFQYVGVSNLPDDYEARLVEMFPGQFNKLRLYSPDPYDLALSKLERNSSKDRDDVEFLAQACRLKPEVLRERYEKELRPYLANQDRHDLTLKLWLESCFSTPRSP